MWYFMCNVEKFLYQNWNQITLDEIYDACISLLSKKKSLFDL